MNRRQLDHVLRAASRILDERDILVIGSQSILASHDADNLPVEATSSMEVDVAVFDDTEDAKADLVDGAIGELSPFHETFGYYAQGVGVTTATLPSGWQERVILYATPGTAPGRGLCLEPHDCVLSKLAAGREKDLAFAGALVQHNLIDPDVLAERVDTLPVHPSIRQHIRDWIAVYR